MDIYFTLMATITHQWPNVLLLKLWHEQLITSHYQRRDVITYPWPNLRSTMSAEGACYVHIDGSVQDRRNSSALAMELRLSCTEPLIWYRCFRIRPVVVGHMVLSFRLCIIKRLDHDNRGACTCIIHKFNILARWRYMIKSLPEPILSGHP